MYGIQHILKALELRVGWITGVIFYPTVPYSPNTVVTISI